MAQGKRYNTGKPQWGLVPQSALLPMVKVLEYGAKKYSPNNWQKGLSITEICESMKRHLDAFMEGEDNDPESQLSHIGHIQCNALFLSWMKHNRPDLDDRNVYENKNSNIDFSKILQGDEKETKNLLALFKVNEFYIDPNQLSLFSD